MKKFLFCVICIFSFTITPLLPGEGQGVRFAFACEIKPYFSPADDVQGVILTELSHAKKSVLVAAYGIASPEIAAKLCELKKAGVDVTVYLDRTQAAGKGSQADALRAAGVKVLVKKSRLLMHDKYMVIDGSEVLTGSYNFSRGAAHQDNNMEVITDCPDLCEAFKANFKDILTGGE